MPIKIPETLPAYKALAEENIFVMTEQRALHQDIRPLEIALLNIMPDKIITETQLLRLLGNTALQVNVVFLKTATHTPTHTPPEHLDAFYRTFDDVKQRKFDGLIITGAPVETIDFEQVHYWDEIKEIMDWSVTHVFSTMHICWGAQAGLYYHYGIPKYPLPNKVSGVFSHRLGDEKVKLLRGFDDIYFFPHSRHAEVKREDIIKDPRLTILSESEDAGVCIVSAKQGRQIFILGHPEYDPHTLKKEYERDVTKGMDIAPPKNYFPNDDPLKPPIVNWRGHANMLFANWLNYYVYQETPYLLEEI